MILTRKIKEALFKKRTYVRRHLSYPDVSMYEMVRRCANKYPDLTAYSYYGNSCTYKTYIKKIDTCALAFARLGVKKGDVVSIAMPNTPEAIICFYALNKIGAVINMIHPLSSEEELKFALETTKSKYAVVADIVYGKVKNIKDNLNLEKIIFTPVSESMDPITKIGYKFKTIGKINSALTEDTIPYYRFYNRSKFYNGTVKDTGVGSDVAVMLHSGGTTGKPKCVVLTNKNFNAVALGLLETTQDMGPGVSTLSIMPIFHGFGLACTFHAVNITGGEAIILPTVSPKEFDETILKYKPNTIGCVPSLLEGLPNSKKLKDADLSFLKCIICGGDAISDKLCLKLNEFLYDHGSEAKVRAAFGMTECTAGVTMVPKDKYKVGSIGYPIPDTDVKIIDPDTHKECGVDEVGEICFSGPSVMKEYLNDEEETNNVLKKHKDGKIWMHSGDLGYKDKDGCIFFKTRLKRMIVTSGYNVYPGQIEQIILEHPYVEACAVVGVPHPYKKEVVKAYIVLKEGLVLNSEIKKSIKEHCAKNIAAYALPYAYGYRKELPKTKIGKIAYKELINDKEEETND